MRSRDDKRGVQFHLADHRTDVGHRQSGQRELQVGDLIGRLLRFHHPIVDDAIDRHGGIVAGDDALLGDLDHLLLHVEPAPDLIDVRQHEIEARLQHARVRTEAFHSPYLSLRHGLHAGEQGDHDKDQDQHPDDDDGLEHAELRWEARHEARGIRQELTLPLREGEGTRTCCPSPNPLPQGEGEKLS